MTNYSDLSRFIGSDRDACGLGLVVRLNHPPSRQVITKGLATLVNLSHRGAVGADGKSGDGAGILTDIPHDFFSRRLDLPDPGNYACGVLFVRGTSLEAATAIKHVAETVKRFSLRVIHRHVPVDHSVLGHIASDSEPLSYQIFLVPNRGLTQSNQLSVSRLQAIRYQCNHKLREALPCFAKLISLSTKTVPYKAMTTPEDLRRYYRDLQSEEFISRFALVHTRFSTNTLPKWELIQPFHVSCHNGEFNTLRGNLNWFANDTFANLKKMRLKLDDILDYDASDSCQFDNVAAWYRGQRETPGRLDTIIRQMIPPSEVGLSEKERAAFRDLEHSFPSWEGPALVAFCDGDTLGAVADRSGLRPARFSRQSDGWFYLGSEAGACPMATNLIVEEGRLGAGEMIAIDLTNGVLSDNAAILNRISQRDSLQPTLLGSKSPSLLKVRKNYKLIAAQQLLSEEEINHVILPMAKEASEPTGSMGSDLPIAALRPGPQVLYDFFHQKFAQVTNPALDAIRERGATSLTTRVGSTDSMFEFEHPFITPAAYQELCRRLPTVSLDLRLSRHKTIPMVLNQIVRTVKKRLNRAEFCLVKISHATAAETTRGGAKPPVIPTILATSYLHQELVASGQRRQVALVCDTDDARTVHHMAVLVGFGADLIFPRLAYELAQFHGTIENMRNALAGGLLKIMSKMGIATVGSYRGAQIFDVVGFNQDIMQKVFPQKRILADGRSFSEIEQQLRHQFTLCTDTKLIDRGLFRWSPTGLPHQHSPAAIASLQRAVRFDDEKSFHAYVDEVNQLSQRIHLRGGVQLMPSSTSTETDQGDTDTETDILSRFVTGAMSIGSISPEAHEAIAEAANKIGVKSNSGEGGEDPRRNAKIGGTSRRSAIRQVASGRFGVTADYLAQAQEIQIKICQGAKPGEGGHLPGKKVDPYIAKLRFTVPGTPLISPPPHHDIYSIEDLAQLIFDLRCVNPKANISVKLAATTGVDVVAVGVAKAGANTIVISGFDGGTGASPLSSIHHAGLPFELGLWDVHRLLVMSGLRHRVRLQVDGGLRTPKDILVATALGADEFGFGSVALVALGCVMMRQCHNNSCPVGIATQNPKLRELFPGEPNHLVKFFTLLADGVKAQLHSLGYRRLDELRGRLDLLKPIRNEGVNFIPYLTPIGKSLDCGATPSNDRLTPHPPPHIPNLATVAHQGRVIKLDREIRNTERSLGASLAGALALIQPTGEVRPPKRRVCMHLTGYAGPSFMAFASEPMFARLAGTANDYVGKGLCGAEVVIQPAATSQTFAPPSTTPVLAGNVCLYGATSGQLYVAGRVGERFAVRNSGAIAVVEGMGQNGCEYMTGGAVVNLGETGHNLGAGMSGGAAFLLRCKIEGAHFVALEFEDVNFVKQLLIRHAQHTQSERALSLLRLPLHKLALAFGKVIHPEYSRSWRTERSELLAKYFKTSASHINDGAKDIYGVSFQREIGAGDRRAFGSR